MRNIQVRGATTEILLLEIAEKLNILAKNPDLSSQIKKAYALNESEALELENANKTIVEAESLRAEFAKKEKKYSDIEDQILLAESLRIANEKNTESLKRERYKLDEERQNIKKEKQALDEFSKDLSVRESKIKTLETSLAEQQDCLDKQRIEIKDALEKSKLIFGGLQ